MAASENSSAEKAKPIGRQVVGDMIRQAILSNDLVPGQRLVEADLCELLGTSRGTLRSALADLEHEGLVERIANRGARVRVVGLDEALDLVEVRMTLELLCVRRAAERLSDTEIAVLRECAEELKACVAQNDIPGFAVQTQKIFRTYVRAAQQPAAEETLNRVRERLTRHSLRLTYRPGRARVALPYWLDIIEALCARDPGAAQAAVTRHAENVADFMRSVFKESQKLSSLPA